MNYTVQRKNIKSKCKEPISRLKVWKQITLELYLAFLSLTQLKEQVTVTIPGQTLRIPGGCGSKISRKLEHEGFKIVSLKRRPPLPRKYFWYSSLLKVESALRTQYGQMDYVNENSNDTNGNRIRDLPTCSAVYQPNSPPPAYQNTINRVIH